MAVADSILFALTLSLVAHYSFNYLLGKVPCLALTRQDTFRSRQEFVADWQAGRQAPHQSSLGRVSLLPRVACDFGPKFTLESRRIPLGKV